MVFNDVGYQCRVNHVHLIFAVGRTGVRSLGYLYHLSMNEWLVSLCHLSWRGVSSGVVIRNDVGQSNLAFWQPDDIDTGWSDLARCRHEKRTRACDDRGR